MSKFTQLKKRAIKEGGTSQPSNGNQCSSVLGGRADFLLILFLSLFVGVSYGLTYGNADNQQYYLLNGLKLLDSTFLSSDWFISNTTYYHRSFAYLVAAFQSLGILPWALAIINVLVIAASCWIFLTIVRAVTGRQAILVWLIFVLAFIILLRTRSVAVSALFGPALQPSTLGAFGFLGAIAAFILGRYRISGVCLAFGGAFHTNFLLLGFILFGIAYLVQSWRDRNIGYGALFIRGIWQFAPALIVFAATLPIIIDVMGLDLSSAERAEGARILFDIVVPYQYKPNNFIYSFIPYFGYSLIGLSFFNYGKKINEASRRFNLLFLTSFVLVTSATILTTVIFVNQVAHMFFWRLAPFVLVFSIIAGGVAVIHVVNAKSRQDLPRPWQCAVASTGFLMTLCYASYLCSRRSPLLIVVGIGGGFLGAMWIVRRFGLQRRLFDRVYFHRWRFLVMLFFAAIFVASATELKFRHFTLICSECRNVEEHALYKWARTTKPTSIFLVPLTLERFRL